MPVNITPRFSAKLFSVFTKKRRFSAKSQQQTHTEFSKRHRMTVFLNALGNRLYSFSQSHGTILTAHNFGSNCSYALHKKMTFRIATFTFAFDHRQTSFLLHSVSKYGPHNIAPTNLIGILVLETKNSIHRLFQATFGNEYYSQILNGKMMYCWIKSGQMCIQLSKLNQNIKSATGDGEKLRSFISWPLESNVYITFLLSHLFLHETLLAKNAQAHARCLSRLTLDKEWKSTY